MGLFGYGGSVRIPQEFTNFAVKFQGEFICRYAN